MATCLVFALLVTISIGHYSYYFHESPVIYQTEWFFSKSQENSSSKYRLLFQKRNIRQKEISRNEKNNFSCALKYYSDKIHTAIIEQVKTTSLIPKIRLLSSKQKHDSDNNDDETKAF